MALTILGFSICTLASSNFLCFSMICQPFQAEGRPPRPDMNGLSIKMPTIILLWYLKQSLPALGKQQETYRKRILEYSLGHKLKGNAFIRSTTLIHSSHRRIFGTKVDLGSPAPASLKITIVSTAKPYRAPQCRSEPQ